MHKNQLYSTADWESLTSIAKEISESVSVLSDNDINGIKELFLQGKLASKPDSLSGSAFEVGATIYATSIVIMVINFIKWYYDNINTQLELESVIGYYESEKDSNIFNDDVRKAINRYFNDIIRFVSSDNVNVQKQDVKESNVSYLPNPNNQSWYEKIFSRRRRNVFVSPFAPAEVKRKSHLQVQVYLHLYEESEKVKSFAKESDKNAERRDYIPLSLKLKKGDKVDVEFNVYGETRLSSERKSIIWQGSFTKCSFDYFVPKGIDVDELCCEANIFVNGAVIGETKFITRIVEIPQNHNPEILSKSFKKIFISYAHKDFDKVKFMAKAYNAQGVDYFFDRDYLKAGDIYPKKIKDYIDTSDLFILCWSENAAKSEYVEKEKSQALSLSKNIDENKGTLTIHPLSIEPRAELPSDMKDDYNFEVI